MALKDWKKKRFKNNNNRWKTLWIKGNEDEDSDNGFSILNEHIYIQKTNNVGEWEVGADRIINKNALIGNYKFFKGKRAKIRATNFARAYRRKY